MARSALLLHGNQNITNLPWMDWLKNRLLWRGLDVDAPVWNIDGANTGKYLDTQIEALAEVRLDRQTTVVAHDAGAGLALAALQRLDPVVKVEAVYLIAPVVPPGRWHWKRLTQSTDQMRLWWSRDDALLLANQVDPLAAHLDIDPVIFEGRGHFDQHKQLPELLEAIV